MRELHGVGRPSLGRRTQVGCIAEHLGQRNLCANLLHTANQIVHALDQTTTTVQVTDYITHVFFRRLDFDLHDRLQQHRLSLHKAFFERHRTGDLKRHFRRVNIVVRTIKQGDLHVHHWEACEHAILELLLDTLIDSRDVFLRNHTAHDLVNELVTFARLLRLHLDPDVTVLTTTTGLTHELAFLLNTGTNGFAVSNLRLAYVRFYLELALETVNDDVEVQLAHTGNNGLTRLFVRMNTERRVFLCQTLQRQAHFLLVSLGLGLYRDRDYRLRELHALQNNRALNGAQGVTSSDVFQTHTGSNITRANFFNFLTVVRVHLHQTTNALTAVFNRVQNRITGVNHTGVNPDKGQGTDEWVSSNFERQRGERLVISGVTLGRLTIGQHTVDRRDVGRSRQVANNRVQHRLNTLVLERGATHGRNDLTRQSALTETLMNFILGQFTFLEVFVHQLFVSFSSGLHQLFAPLLALSAHFFGRLSQVKSRALVVFVPENRLHGDQVDHALEGVFLTDRQLQRNRVGLQTGFHLLNHAQEVCAYTVHFVYESQTRNAVLVGLTPYGFRLGLYTTHGAVNHHRAVENPHGTLYFNGEVHVTWGIDNVDTVLGELLGHARPETGRCGGGNGNPALLLLRHPVHGRGAFVGFTELMADTCVKQDPLTRRGFTSVDVGTDPDIAITINLRLTCHG